MGSTRIVIPWSKGFAGACRVSRAPVITRDVDHDKRGNMSKDVDHTSGYHTKSMLCVPVTHEDGTVMAVIQMINKLGPTGPQHPVAPKLRTAFDDEDLHLLEDFAVHLSLALSRLNDLGKHNDEWGHASFSLPKDDDNGELEQVEKKDTRKRTRKGSEHTSAAKRRKKVGDEEDDDSEVEGESESESEETIEEGDAGSSGYGCLLM